MICGTKEEAEEALGKLHKEMSYKFCPLVKGYCVANCASYHEGRIQGPHTKGYTVWEPSCSSPIITGVIYIEEG